MLLYSKLQTDWELSNRTALIIASTILLAHVSFVAWLGAMTSSGATPSTIKDSTLFVQWTAPPSPKTLPVKVSAPAAPQKTATPQKRVEKPLAAPKIAVPKNDSLNPSESTAATSTAATPSSSAPVRVMSVSYSRPPQPVYPAQSKKLGEEGRVDILITLDENGAVQTAAVHTSSGFARLDNAALAAVQNARYQPHLEKGQAVRAQAIIPITFRLEEDF